MPANTDIAFMLSFAAFLGVAAQLIARAINVPGIVALLALGLAVGPDGLKLIQPAILGHHLSMLVGIAVAIILFGRWVAAAVRGAQAQSEGSSPLSDHRRTANCLRCGSGSTFCYGTRMAPCRPLWHLSNSDRSDRRIAAVKAHPHS